MEDILEHALVVKTGCPSMQVSVILLTPTVRQCAALLLAVINSTTDLPNFCVTSNRLHYAVIESCFWFN